MCRDIQNLRDEMEFRGVLVTLYVSFGQRVRFHDVLVSMGV